jgi:hypothetical protein
LAVDDDSGSSETTETIEIHPLVHEILRNLLLRQIPRDELQFQLAIMMNILHGWILHVRNRPDYFALDQLVSHGDSLMRTIGTLGELPTKSAKHNYIYHYTKIRLQLEIGTCRMSRGDVNAAVNLARRALLDLAKLPRDAIRDAVALEAVSAIVVDLSDAGADVATMRPFALMAEKALKSSEWFGGNSAQLAYEKAYLVKSFLTKRPEYRGDTAIARALAGIGQIVARDPSDEIRPNVLMDQINQHIEDGTLEETRPLIAQLRQAANPHDTITIDCLETDIALRRKDFQIALPAIDNLLSTELHSTHHAAPLSQGLGKIFQTLQRLIAEETGQDLELSAVAHEVRIRAEELYASVLAENESSGESDGPTPAEGRRRNHPQSDADAAQSSHSTNIGDYANRVYRANRDLGL